MCLVYRGFRSNGRTEETPTQKLQKTIPTNPLQEQIPETTHPVIASVQGDHRALVAVKVRKGTRVLEGNLDPQVSIEKSEVDKGVYRAEVFV